MTNPRDPTPELAVPVNPLTGRRLTDQQSARLSKLREASFLVRAVLHEIDGSSFAAEIGPDFEVDDHYGGRDLATAATRLDDCMLWAAKSVLGSGR